MENYFNYFTEIEEHFWKKRGTAILLTTLDWALIDSWKQANVPIEAILRGIDRTFDKYEQSRSRKRRVNSLAYCHQAVLEAAGEMERGQLPHDSAPPPFPHDALSAYLEKNASSVAQAAGRLQEKHPGETASAMNSIAESLREQALLAQSNQTGNLQSLEQRMGILEERMVVILKQLCPEETLLEIRSERDRQMAPFRAKMSGEQVRQLEIQFEMRKLLEWAELPRLSLFYL